jgi:hypothetical protein
LRLKILSVVLLFSLHSIQQAHATATLFLGEPYGYDGAFAGTGHAALYLSHVCAITPVILRPCALGETGVVLSRYRGVAGYDWIAIPLIPYLYAVERQSDIPLFADRKMVGFLRDRYRRDRLESLIPDLPGGATPGGDWYQLIGASYLRTIYAFEIPTSPEQDTALIRKLNDRPNRQRWNLVTANCADFARQILSFYYPHSVHRGIIEDLGVTTPKHLASTLSRYSRRHPELQTSSFVIPQVPGTVPRSKPVHGVLECALTAKKYMLPLFLLHPYVAGSLVVGYLGRGHFDPSHSGLILDSNHQLSAVLTHSNRSAFQFRFEELLRATSSADIAADQRNWASLRAAAEPAVDVSGAPTLEVGVGSGVIPLGIARVNILGVPEGSEFAANLVKARLREELKSAAEKKTARTDVENDLALLQRLQLLQPERLASAAGSSTASRIPVATAQ